MKILKQVCGTIFFLCALCVVPLYFENNYIDLLQAKAHAVIVLNSFVLVFVAILFFIELFRKKGLEKPDKVDVLLLVYGVLALVSGLLSSDFTESLFGMQCWCVGVFVIFTTILISTYLSHNFEYKQNLLIPVIIVNAIIFLLIILNSVRIDPLDMQTNIVEWQKHIYLSTIGNTNWLSGYMCLIMPMLVFLFLNSRVKGADVLYLIAIVPGLFSFTLCGSDSLFLGIGFCAFFAIPYIFAKEERLRRLMLVLSLYGASLLLIRYIPAFADKVSKTNGIHLRMLNPIVSFSLLVVGIIGFVFLKNRYQKVSKKTQKVITIIALSVLSAVVVTYIIKTVVTFNEDWGTQRGLIWKHSFDLFDQFSLKQKLFGVGPEMIGPMMSKLTQTFNLPVLAVHSEVLQILMCNGIIGFAVMISLIVTLIVQFIRRKIWIKDYAVFFIPIMAYLGQALVNSAMATNISVLSVMYICYRSFYLREEKKNEHI